LETDKKSSQSVVIDQSKLLDDIEKYNVKLDVLKSRTNEIDTDISIANELIIGWEGVVDSDGDAVTFSETVKQQLLDIPTVASAIIVAYFDSLAGVKTKN
jgi:hypothetical protein